MDTKTFQQASFCLVLGAAAAIPGFWALAHAPIVAQNTQIADGSYQRLYEERFVKAVPGRGLASDVWSAVLYEVFDEAAEGAVVGRNDWLYTSEEFVPATNDYDLAAELAEAQSVLDQYGTKLVPVIVPDKARSVPEFLPQARSEYFENRYALALEILAAANASVIDLRPSLAIGDDGEALFLRTDTHWTPKGAQRVASAIAAQGLTADLTQSSFTTEPTGERPFRGDLMTFVDTGSLARLAGPAEETLPTFETFAAEADAGALGLFGESEPQVALVGTSYSARPEFHFEGFLKEELAADVVNHAAVGVGPYKPMIDFLAGVVRDDAAPALVIWEIPERYIAIRKSQ